MKIRAIRLLRWLRRSSQFFFLALFVALLFRVRYSGLTLDLAAETPAVHSHFTRFFWFDPFVALGLIVHSRVFTAVFLLSLVTIIATVLFGRFFCGWVCPFGSLHHFAGFISGRGGAAGRRMERGAFSRLQNLKYYLLIALLVSGACRVIQPSFADPLSILSRSLALAVFPAAVYSLERIGDLAGSFDSRLMRQMSLSIRDFLSSRQLGDEAVYFNGAAATGAVFLALLLANVFIPRFWCRFLCPLGALLGFAARFSVFGMKTDSARCTMCMRCVGVCRGARCASVINGSGGARRISRKDSECFACLNCMAVCAGDALGYKALGVRDASECGPDLTRRGLIAAVGAGFLSLGMSKIFPPWKGGGRLIRPPGALPEGDFGMACLRCGTCSRICPTHAIHTCVGEAGWEGIWTPRLIPRIGYCVYSCTLCGQVCPSGAIRKLSYEEKVGSGNVRPVKLGTAAVNRNRCISWANGMRCLACEEVCPVSPKAIKIDRDTAAGIGRPAVDSLLCVGCGHCEYVCPVEGEAAIRVFSAGERREPL